jgi:predicted nuclease with TOPRIM domain
MTGETENLILAYMRKFDDKLDRLADEFHNLKVRVSFLEEGLAGVNRRLDGVERRLDHIEKRLELQPPLLPGFRDA